MAHLLACAPLSASGDLTDIVLCLPSGRLCSLCTLPYLSIQYACISLGRVRNRVHHRERQAILISCTLRFDITCRSVRHIMLPSQASHCTEPVKHPDLRSLVKSSSGSACHSPWLQQRFLLAVGCPRATRSWPQSSSPSIRSGRVRSQPRMR
ncbi:hypothetical protein BD311DRAFT_223859 [Dichomitus squalens]|uniref:Uncharacterized protein n=1 Tax=Dichomitus squalens TaxID=114155 RepID=A0A4Q9MRX5_9APHY|nr:hypothetical protein BD311DRAFT_223859 [Dichomitus squalens]